MPPITTAAPPPSALPKTTRPLSALSHPRGLPLFGNALQIDLTRLHLILEGWAAQYGPLYTIRIGQRQVLIVSDAAAIAPILHERPDGFRRASALQPVFSELGGHGIFSAEGASWKRQRRLIMPAFTMRQLRELHPSIALFTGRLRDHWQAAAQRAATVDVRMDLMRYTVDVTSQIVFGRDLGTIDNPDSPLQQHFSRIFGAINRRVNAPFPYWRYFKLPADRAVERSISAVSAVLAEQIADAHQVFADQPERAAKTLLEALIVAQREVTGEERLSDKDIAHNVLTLLLAGEDTTSNTLAWVLHYLAHEPEVQARLRAEADEVLGAASVVNQFDDVVKLRYTAAVIQETLRLRSAAPIIFLEALRDATVGDVAVPARTPIFLLTRYCALDERNFYEPRRFHPQRWLTTEAAAAHNPRAALAFGGGPRTCPGRALALLESALVLSMVARNFDIAPVSTRDEVEEYFDFTMQPRGLRVRFQARATAAFALAQAKAAS